jgi:ribonucleoside-diphosphate reductase alpha chain
VYKNWNVVGGLSFLPHSGGIYPLAPYTEITAKEYEYLVGKMPALDFTELALYEKSDETVGSAEMACSGGSCELR